MTNEEEKVVLHAMIRVHNCINDLVEKVPLENWPDNPVGPSGVLRDCFDAILIMMGKLTVNGACCHLPGFKQECLVCNYTEDKHQRKSEQSSYDSDYPLE